MSRKTFSFSMDAPECVSCVHYEDCKNKRRVACMYIEPCVATAAAESAQPIMADILVKHDYRDIKIAENTTVTIDLEELKQKMNDDFYKSIRCQFLQDGA